MMIDLRLRSRAVSSMRALLLASTAAVSNVTLATR
jgi:predicted nucleic acid-binding protein